MAKKVSKCLVIDASVARAAGLKGAESPTSSNCRNFLRKVLAICHRVAFSDEILAEWEKHESRIAFKWRRVMVGKKKIIPLGKIQNNELRDKIGKSAKKKNDQKAMLKDIRLIEAALEADNIVVSCDDEVRHLYCKFSQKIKTLKNVMWVNPTEEHEKVIEWLKKGAKPVKDKMLRCHSSG